MPKTIEGVNTGAFKPTTQVPQPGEARVAADIERVARDAFDNFAFLLAMQATLAQSIAEHGHALASSTVAGFMSPGDKQKLDGLSTQIAAHAHAIATAADPGFMSAADKAKLNGIEAGAHTVTRARAETALGIVRGEFTLPESVFSAGQTKSYSINAEGTKYDAPIVTSETLKSDSFVMAYHVEGNEIDVRIRNVSSSSKTFPGGTVKYMVFNGPSA